MRQTNLVIKSGRVTDFISVTDRTESMLLIAQARAEITVHVPELFCLKKSFVPTVNSQAQEK